MRSKLLLILLILGCCKQVNAQFIFDPFDFQLNDSTINIKPEPIQIGEPSVALFDNTYLWYGSFPKTDITVKVVVEHDLIQINNEIAIDEFNKIYISLNESDSILNFKLRLIEDGKVVKEHTEKDLITTVEENKRYKILAVEGLKKGQFIERLIIKLYPFKESGFSVLQQNFRIKKRFVSIAAPSIVKFKIKCYPKEIKFIDTIIDKKIRYQFSNIGEIPAFEPEDYSFPQARKIRLEFALEQNFATNKKLNSWADKGRNIFEVLMTSEKKEKKFISKLVLKENWAGFTGKEQLFTIENYLKKNINTSSSSPYVGDVETLFRIQYGSNYSVVRAYIMIFEELKIKWEILFTVLKDAKEFDESFPSDSYTNDPLFYFPTLNLYSDPVDSGKRTGEISSLYEGQKAMYVKPLILGEEVTGITRISKIPEQKMEDIIREYSINVAWSDDLNSIITGTLKGNYHANDSKKMLYSYLDKEKANEIIENQVRGESKDGEFKIVEVNNYQIDKFDNYYNPIEIKYEWKTDAFIEQVGNNILLKYGLMIGRQIELYEKKTRLYPVEMYYPHVQKSMVSIKIPEGYTAKGFEQKNKKIDYKDTSGKMLFGIDVQVIQEGESIVMKINEYYAKSSYSIAEYDQFREVINTAADINAYTLLLEKKAK